MTVRNVVITLGFLTNCHVVIFILKKKILINDKLMVWECLRRFQIEVISQLGKGAWERLAAAAGTTPDNLLC